jgi:hypothetical protein
VHAFNKNRAKEMPKIIFRSNFIKGSS